LLIGDGHGGQPPKKGDIWAIFAYTTADGINHRTPQPVNERKGKGVGIIKMMGLDVGFLGPNLTELMKAKQ
jgi:hypothetical protein